MVSWKPAGKLEMENKVLFIEKLDLDVITTALRL